METAGHLFVAIMTGAWRVGCASLHLASFLGGCTCVALSVLASFTSTHVLPVLVLATSWTMEALGSLALWIIVHAWYVLQIAGDLSVQLGTFLIPRVWTGLWVTGHSLLSISQPALAFLWNTLLPAAFSLLQFALSLLYFAFRAIFLLLGAAASFFTSLAWTAPLPLPSIS